MYMYVESNGSLDTSQVDRVELTRAFPQVLFHYNFDTTCHCSDFVLLRGTPQPDSKPMAMEFFYIRHPDPVGDEWVFLDCCNRHLPGMLPPVTCDNDRYAMGTCRACSTRVAMHSGV